MPISINQIKHRQGKLRVTERRAAVADLLMQGTYNYAQICHKLGLNPETGESTIANDVKFIKSAWKESALRDFDTEKGRILNELQKVKSEAWEAWERSKNDRVFAKDKKILALINRKERLRKGKRTEEEIARERIDEDVPDEPIPIKEEHEVRTEQRDGDPRFLSLVMDCIQEEETLLGIVTKPGELSTAPPVIGFVIHTPGQLVAQPAPGQQLTQPQPPELASPVNFIEESIEQVGPKLAFDTVIDQKQNR